MNKFKLLLLFFIISLSFMGCSHNVTKDEALKLAKPIIASILKYKKNINHYPNSLMEIKNFPYKIKPLATNGEYRLAGKYMLYAGGFETGLSPESGFIYHFSISFDESRGSKAITSIFVGFKKDGKYKISYTRMPPAWKQ